MVEIEGYSENGKVNQYMFKNPLTPAIYIHTNIHILDNGGKELQKHF